jgi:hypothetical protein
MALTLGLLVASWSGIAMALGAAYRRTAPTGLVATADYWPRDSWAFAGYASPDAALRSCFWAANTGDVKTFHERYDGRRAQTPGRGL